MHFSSNLLQKVAAVILLLCGAYFLVLALYVLFSPFLPASFGPALGMSSDFFPIAMNLSSKSFGLGLIVLMLPILLISAGFFITARFLHKGSRDALYVTIAFLLLPILGLLFKPFDFFIVHSTFDVFALAMRVFFLVLGVSLIVITFHTRQHRK
jgi:hypothetical protein